ncbi:MAG: hypothetical protein KAS32_19320 [Candidatus Peribacteraceae bacterium]|nr:hypothetical protein [Candidatus Peribacteraceae bacterium]
MFKAYLACDDDCKDPDCSFSHELEYEDFPMDKVEIDLKLVTVVRGDYSYLADVPENMYVVFGFTNDDLALGSVNILIQIIVKEKELVKLGIEIPGRDWDGVSPGNITIKARAKSFEEDPNGELVCTFMGEGVDCDPYIDTGN